MFGWPSIGLAMAFGAFFGVYAGFGVALLIHLWCENAQPEPPSPDGGYVDNSAQDKKVQDFTVFDAVVAERLLEQCDL